MANHKSSEKRARQTPKKQARNTQVKSSVKTLEKALLKAIDTKSKDITESLKAYTSKMMAAASKGVLKKQTVARKISRLSSKVSQTLSK